MAARKRGKILRLNTFWTGTHLSKLGVSYFIDNECTPAELKKIWEHLLDCEKCRLTVGDTVSTDRIGRESLVKMPPEILPKLLSRLGFKP